MRQAVLNANRQALRTSLISSGVCGREAGTLANHPRLLETSMPYTINRTIDGASFDAVEQRTRQALADKGFGVLTEIDVKATMKKKLDAEMPPYRILGACNPDMAYQAIRIEPRVGAMLPCNVILRQVGEAVEVSAIDPVASMQAIDNDELIRVAGEVRDLLAAAIAAI
tara:strand:+ start:182 stop:688 length:507 start_codon:yes stop_codon:yes gene_type:complete